MRSRSIGTLVGIIICAHAALAVQPPTEEQKQAERLFRDVYGKEYDRLNAGKSAADKVAFARKLWEASKESRDSPDLARCLADKAIPFSLADPSGYAIALEIRRSQLKEGKDRIEQLAALAAVLDRIARSEKPDQHAKFASELIEIYREAVELAHDANRDADASGYVAKAKAAASLFYPATQAAAIQKELQTDQVYFELERKNAAEFKRWNEVLREKPDDPKANLAIGMAYLREGKILAAAPHLKACALADLRKAGELLTATPAGDPAKIGDAFRAATDDLPADRSALLASARYQYEAALQQDPKHPDAARMKLLVKELPSAAAFSSSGAVALIDEDQSVIKLVEKSAGDAKVAWADPGYQSAGALRLASNKPDTVESRNWVLPGGRFAISDTPAEKEYRYLRFAYKCTGGTQAIIEIDNAQYLIGAVKATTNQQHVIATEIKPEWVVVTRDLYADVNTKYTVGFMKIQTDGEIQVDAVYLGKSLRSLNRIYPKPPAK